MGRSRGACAETGCGIRVHDGDPGGCKAGLVLVTPSAAKAVAFHFPEVALVSMSVASHTALTWNKHAKHFWGGNWNGWEEMSASAGDEKGLHFLDKSEADVSLQPPLEGQNHRQFVVVV